MNIRARNQYGALAQVVTAFDTPNIQSEKSRNGDTIRLPGLTTITLTNPHERVLMMDARDANPFFHLFESLWMLAGRDDVALPAKFVGSMRNYSDNGETLHGAYGFRWRYFFGYDQLSMIINEIKRNPNSRRCVLTMWEGNARDELSDLHMAVDGGKDVPCNTHAYFDTIDGRLNMTVCCRSNDMVLGAYGANAVHFSILLEYLSAASGLPMGVYRQFSNNFHAYTELYSRILDGQLTKGALEQLGDSVKASDIYASGARSVPLVAYNEDPDAFLQDCEEFCDNALDGILTREYRTAFMNNVAAQMLTCWTAWKDKEYDSARNAALHIEADDWRTAAQSWLEIRELRRAMEM
jgi:thymidylate synthase